MADDKISDNEKIDAALHLDGDPERVRDFYEDWAARYNIDTASSEYCGPQVSVSLLLEQQQNENAPNWQNRAILDAGCGTGYVGTLLRDAGYRVIDGFDLSDAMAEMAVATACYRDVKGGIDMMKAADFYASESYDVILSVGVFTLGHVPPEALQVLLDLTRPGGILVISTRTHYYDESDFQQVVDDLEASGRLVLLKLIKDAPYNNDGDAHYWVLRKPA